MNGLEHAGRRVDAQIVEDRQVEDQEREQAPGQTEQQPGGRPEGLAMWGLVCVGMGTT